MVDKSTVCSSEQSLDSCNCGSSDKTKETTSQVRTLCIFTPTFNRASCLDQLFLSLKNQTCFDFCWLIVDDGSTDDTEALVHSFQDSNALFPIEYVKQENGGKARAHNTAVSHCCNELFFCVDSDDYITVDAVETILNTWHSVCHDSGIAGIVALDGSDSTTPLSMSFPEGLEQTTLWDLYSKHRYKGDTALVYRTELLELFPFEVPEGEKFMAESFVYNQIDQHYELKVLNRIIKICRYLEDGYTSNVRKVTRENPRSYALLKSRAIGYSDTILLKYENSILYLVGCILGRIKGGIRNAPNRPLAALAYLPARLLCATVFRQRRESKK